MTALETHRPSRRQRFPANSIPAPVRGTRRMLLRKMGLLGAAVLTGCRSRASVSSSSEAAIPEPAAPTPAPIRSSSQADTPASSSPTPAPIVDEPVCILTPEATEGPFYFNAERVRRDIIEDRVGAPLQMSVRVVGVQQDCEPLEGAIVDIWHADAAGAYSGYPDQPGGLDTTGQTFLRGIQLTGIDGIARFDTIYPGWYPGRTVHIHFKVHYQGNSYLTSQFYFPDEISDRVFERSPYGDRPNRATRNANDSVLRGDPAESNILATVTEESAGYVGTITVGVPL